MGANRQFKKSPSEPDAPLYQRPRAYYDEDNVRCTLPLIGPAYRAVREFERPYPRIERWMDGKPMDRGGRMPVKWWANELAK